MVPHTAPQRAVSVLLLTEIVEAVMRNDDGAVVFGHWRHGRRIIGVRQMLLGVQVGGQDQRFTIAAVAVVIAAAHPTWTVPPRELVTTPGRATHSKRRSR